MMKMDETTIKIRIPEKILAFIDQLIEKKIFETREEFILHAIRLLAELYGLSGVSVIDRIIDHYLKHKKARIPSELSEEELERVLEGSFQN